MLKKSRMSLKVIYYYLFIYNLVARTICGRFTIPLFDVCVCVCMSRRWARTHPCKPGWFNTLIGRTMSACHLDITNSVYWEDYYILIEGNRYIFVEYIQSIVLLKYRVPFISPNLSFYRPISFVYVCSIVV